MTTLADLLRDMAEDVKRNTQERPNPANAATLDGIIEAIVLETLDTIRERMIGL